jgi:hypothetical protein
VRDQSIIDLDAGVIAKVSEFPHSELSHIVSNYTVGDTNRYMISEMNSTALAAARDEFHRLCFDPLSEFVHCYEDVSEPTFSLFEWTYQI